MNKIDIANIKKELAKREAANYEWTEGGHMSKDDIMLRTTKELNELINEYNNNIKYLAEQEIKKLVDEAFEKYSNDENDNMVIIGACNYYDDSRCASTTDDPLYTINFDGFEHRYNKLAYPIGRNLTHKYEDEKKSMALNEIGNKIHSYFNNLGLKTIYYYWDDHNDAINECWYGVHAITKDYKIVTFVIRDDGMLCDENGFDTFHNKTLYKIN